MEQLVRTELPPHPQDQHEVLDVHFHWETIILDSARLSNLCSGVEDAHVWKVVGGEGRERERRGLMFVQQQRMYPCVKKVKSEWIQ